MKETEKQKIVPKTTEQGIWPGLRGRGNEEKRKLASQWIPTSLQKDGKLGLQRAKQTRPGLRNQPLRWETTTLKTLGRKLVYRILRVDSFF